MDFDAILVRYFGTVDLGSIGPEQLRVGLDRARVDLGMERDRGRRFALWAFLYSLDEAPDLDVAFDDPADREAARDFMDLADRSVP